MLKNLDNPTEPSKNLINILFLNSRVVLLLKKKNDMIIKCKLLTLLSKSTTLDRIGPHSEPLERLNLIIKHTSV